MLWRAEDMATLERQVLASDDAGLLTWWARACEASSNFTQAINCYQRAGNCKVVSDCDMPPHLATGSVVRRGGLVTRHTVTNVFSHE